MSKDLAIKLPRENYALLTDIPENPLITKHFLRDYSILNVDEVGKMICELFKEYENKDFISKRLYIYDRWKDVFGHYYKVGTPILVIDTPDDIKKYDKDRQLIIKFERNMSLKKYITDEPVAWDISEHHNPYNWANYAHLIDRYEGLSFDHKGYEFIKELVYSLAYYQKVHSIEYMNAKETEEVFRKIYKK